MEALLAAFIEYGKSNRNYAVTTLRGYRDDCRAFFRYLATQGVSEPSQITRSHIERYDVMQGGQDKRPKTRRRKIAAIRAFTGWLVDEGQIAANPGARLKLPKVDESERHVPTAKEKDALFDGASRLETEYLCAMATMMLAVMFYGGLRPMEAIALALEDIDLERRNLVVKKGKGRKRREVPINDTLAAHVAAWLPVRLSPSEGSPLLVSPLKRCVSYYFLRTTFNRLKITGGLRAAKNLTSHCLRHWFASKLYANNADIESIRKLLGHSSLSTTQTYLHQMGNELHDAVHTLDSPAAARPSQRTPGVRTSTYRR